jgi:SAM-dependent methyltransferase
MALYDLVTYRHRLTQALVVDPVVDRLLELKTNIANVRNQVPVINQSNADFITQLVDHYENLIELVKKPQEDLANQLATVNKEINEITHRLFANNYELEERYGTVDQVRNNRRIYVGADVEEVIKQRILFNSTWRYPALEVGCRDGEWTQYLVASDPLYIIDRHTEFLESTSERFVPEYQRRLRQYHLIDNNLSMLPTRQFGFIFSWGYFNYVSLDTMTQFLKQAHAILRPGGTFMFSYNNGDTPSGAGMAENFAQSYMPKSILVPLCASLGFIVEKEFDFDPNISWLEVRRAGELHTIKAHQVMGEIKAKTA